MAYETKVILASIAIAVLKSDSKKEMYEYITEIANVEGLTLKPYEDALAKFNLKVKAEWND